MNDYISAKDRTGVKTVIDRIIRFYKKFELPILWMVLTGLIYYCIILITN